MKGLIYRGTEMSDARLPGSDGTVVKTTMCSICGSDLQSSRTDPGVRDSCLDREAEADGPLHGIRRRRHPRLARRAFVRY
jgi:hypothetical protein